MARSLASLLYATSSADPAALGGALAVLSLAAMIACYLPARRASRIDAARSLSGDDHGRPAFRRQLLPVRKR